MGSLEDAKRKRRVKRLAQLRDHISFDLGGFQPEVSDEEEDDEIVEVLANLLYRMTIEVYKLAEKRKPTYIR